MNRRRRTADHPHANHERWLVSYADFITLLFAFFVVMFAASQGDHAKVMKLEQAIQAAFTDLGMFAPTSRKLNLMPSPPVSSSTPSFVINPLDALRGRLAGELKPEIASHALSLLKTRQGLVVRMEELGFFDSGSAQIRPSAMPVLARIAAAVAPMPNALRIEGYTDNVPIHTARFQSNWQLSTARATELVRIFIVDYHISPDRLSASGYAQFHPIASNATAQGRQKNRRVDLVVVSHTPAAAQATRAPPGGKAAGAVSSGAASGAAAASAATGPAAPTH